MRKEKLTLVLKPCPFCGDVPTIKYYDGERSYMISCTNLECPMDFISTELNHDKISIIEIWNTRYEK